MEKSQKEMRKQMFDKIEADLQKTASRKNGCLPCILTKSISSCLTPCS